MTVIAGFDGLLIAHAEDEQFIATAQGRGYRAFEATRPADAETSAIRTLIQPTRLTGCRTPVVHLSSAQSLPLTAAAKAEGLPVIAETCPHYLSFAAEDVADGATQFTCCPPIRDADIVTRCGRACSPARSTSSSPTTPLHDRHEASGHR